MGRGKVELKRIENPVNRQVSFSKRRKGLLKKAHELAVLCDVELGVVIFSGNGKVFEYSNPPGSLTDLIHRYEAITNAQLQETFCNDQQRVIAEIVRLRREKEQLEASTKRLAGEDLSSFTSVHQLSDLEQHLESALGKVHARKDELLTQLIEELQCKINENGHAYDASAAAAGVEMEGMGMAPLSISPPTLFGYLLAVDDASTARTALQLWPQPGDVGCSSSRGLQLS